jgi:heterodisulfide reductase subunit B2
MKMGYYPGCALHGSSDDYDQSLRACLEHLGVELEELDDWICCGASAAHALNARLAWALPARNLGLARRQGWREMLAPCPLCSLQLLKANAELGSAARREEASRMVEIDVDDSVDVRNLIEVLQRVGLDRIASHVVQPLRDCRPACYYGCLLTRPPRVVRFDDPERPGSMEAILRVCGAEPVAWNLPTECCGAGMTLANEDTVLDLSHRILRDAREHGANCLVVACPMCHVNLDLKQSTIERRYDAHLALPVYYLTDLVGRAAGLADEQLGVHRHFVAAG